MLKIRGLVVRFLRSTLMLTLIYGLLGASIADAQSANSGKYCIHAVNMIPVLDRGVVSVVKANVQTKQVVSERHPIATPDSLFSPNGRYAAVWRALSEPEEVTSNMDYTKIAFGLYVVSVATNHAVLLYSVTGDEFANFTGIASGVSSWAWSPDSSKFAYITKDNGQYFINVVDSEGNSKQSKLIAAPKGASVITEAHLYGWSADSLYVATAAISEIDWFDFVVEMNVWTTSGLNNIYSNLMARGNNDKYGALAWAPNGHRLAATLDIQESRESPMIATLSIWSPENGIEAQSSPETLDDDYYYLGWSAKERHLTLLHSWGHGSEDIIFGVDGNQIVKAASESNDRDHIAWALGDNALVLDTYFSEASEATADNTRYKFAMVDAVNQHREIIAVDVDAVLSRDATKVLLYKPQSTAHSFTIFDIDHNKSIPFAFSDSSREKVPNDFLSNKIWSPDGTYVIHKLFERDFINAGFININNSTLHELTIEDVEWVDTHWILYQTREDKHTQEVKLILMNLQTEKSKLLDVLAEEDNMVTGSTSPDREMIAVQGNQSVIVTSLNLDSQFELRIPIKFLNAHSGARITRPALQHTNDYDFDWAKYILAWSPDSSMLAFVADTGTSIEHPELIVVSRDGKELLRKHLPGFIAAYVNWVECDSK